jgi:hypothetical protein
MSILDRTDDVRWDAKYLTVGNPNSSFTKAGPVRGETNPEETVEAIVRGR